MTPSSRWTPSRKQQALQWWLKLILRYVIGGGGLVYEVVIDRLRNPTALVIFGGIAGLPDVLGYRAIVKQTIQDETADRTLRNAAEENES